MSQKTKSVLVRFIKGFISGAITAMVAVPIVVPVEWGGFLGILNMLGIAGTFGGMVGLMLAIQKWASWTD